MENNKKNCHLFLKQKVLLIYMKHFEGLDIFNVSEKIFIDIQIICIYRDVELSN